MTIPAYLLVEGVLDEAVGRRLLRENGLSCETVYGQRGASYIEKKIRGLNNLARGIPFLSIVDLRGSGRDCAPEIVREWLPHPALLMRFRVAVNEIESWLLADRENFARFLGVPVSRIPVDVESIPHPKAFVVNLARRSRKTMVRREFVPQQGRTSTEGHGYTPALAGFVESSWDVGSASVSSPSLERCMAALQELRESLS